MTPLLLFLGTLAAALFILGAYGLADWAAEHRERGDCPECRRNQ